MDPNTASMVLQLIQGTNQMVKQISEHADNLKNMGLAKETIESLENMRNQNEGFLKMIKKAEKKMMA